MISSKEKKLFKKLGVSIVYLFGSHAEGTEHPGSDVDIGLVFSDLKEFEKHANTVYLAMYDLFTELYKDKRVDIVFLHRAGLELCFDVVRHGKVIYEESVEGRLNFEESIFRQYIDFKPLLNQFDDAILERAAND